jgi:hypothetical protein
MCSDDEQAYNGFPPDLYLYIIRKSYVSLYITLFTGVPRAERPAHSLHGMYIYKKAADFYFRELHFTAPAAIKSHQAFCYLFPMPIKNNLGYLSNLRN